MTHEDGRQFRVIALNGVRYPVDDYASYTNTGTFEGKVVDGDFTRDSDKLMSAKIWTSFAGGIGEDHHREGADEGRVWFHTLNADKPYSLALANRVDAYDDAVYPLGDIGGFFYACDAAYNIMKWNETTLAWTDTNDDLTSPPTKHGIAWNGDLYIPQGANGYATYDGTTAAESGSQDVVDFVEWDERIFLITVDGALKDSTDGSTWTSVAQLQTSATPKSLVVYLDRSENEIIYVVADGGLYAYNPTNFRFVRTQLRLPAHPDNGLGADVWRPGEDLFLSAGLQVYRYTGGASVPMGPDRGGEGRNGGLPDELRGRIVDMCSEFNSLMALVEGVSVTATVDPDAEFDPGHEDDAIEISSTAAKSALLAWTGTGWHPRWISSDDSGTPKWIHLSNAQSSYRVWWGYGTSLYTMLLSRTFSDSAQLLRTGEGLFQPTGYLDTGWIDHNMREFQKLASHMEINCTSVTSTELVRVYYKKNFDVNWTLLGVTEPSDDPDSDEVKVVLPFGVAVTDGRQFSRGLSYNRIRFRFEFERGSDATKTPLIDSFVLKFIRIPLTGEVFTFTIPLDKDAEFEGRSMAQIKVELDALLESNEFVLLQHGYNEDELNHRVRLSRLGGRDKTGLNAQGERVVTVIAVPLEGYNGNTEAA